MPSLKEKAIKGVTWTLIETFGLQAVKFILGIILARLLTPRDYGLIGIITVFFAVAEVFIYSGLGAAYVQKKKVTDIDANTVFFTNLGISIVLYGVLWFVAPAISNFYKQPELINLTRVLGLVVIINAFNLIQISQVARNLDFKRKTKITIVSTIISGLAGVTAAYYGCGVWSLVIQQLANRFLITAGLWITNKWNPTLQFSKESFKSMFSFGIWILFSNVIRAIFNNIYVLTIGKLYSVTELGFFSKAKQFKSMASDQIAGAVGVVSFPIFSKFQDDKTKLKSGMKKILQHTLIFIMPILVTLMVVAKPFIILLLTEKWAPTIPYLRLFCIIGVFYPIQNVNNQLIYSIGKSKINFRMAIINNSLRILNIFIMYRFGIAYIIVGEILVTVIMLLINFYYTHKYLSYGFWEQINDIKFIVLGAITSGVITYIIVSRLANLWWMLILGIFGTVSIYILFQWVFNESLFKEVVSLKEQFSNNK